VRNADFTSSIDASPLYSQSRAKGITGSLSAPKSLYGSGASTGAYAKALADMNKIGAAKRMSSANLQHSLDAQAAQSNDIQDMAQLYARGQMYGANQRNSMRGIQAQDQVNQVGNQSAWLKNALGSVSALQGLLG